MTKAGRFVIMRWFAGVFVLGLSALAACGVGLSETAERSALEQGSIISDAAFQGLSVRLQQAIKEGGPAHAVEFCSLNALSIVDSLSTAHGAHIRRTSDRVRSPLDKPDIKEERMMQAMLAEWKAGSKATEIPARVVAYDDSIAYYRPIFISSAACLQCHGSPSETMDASTVDAIAERDPDDKAIGYALGDLRGMWSVRWAR